MSNPLHPDAVALPGVKSQAVRTSSHSSLCWGRRFCIQCSLVWRKDSGRSLCRRRGARSGSSTGTARCTCPRSRSRLAEGRPWGSESWSRSPSRRSHTGLWCLSSGTRRVNNDSWLGSTWTSSCRARSLGRARILWRGKDDVGHGAWDLFHIWSPWPCCGTGESKSWLAYSI